MRNWIATCGAIALSAMLTAACGNSMSSALPTAPSAVTASTSSASTAASGAASINPDGTVIPDDAANSTLGNGNGNGNDKGKDKEKEKDKEKDKAPTNTSPGAPTVPTNPGTSKVEIEGLISSFAGLSLVVNGQTVFVPATAVIRHGSTAFTFAQLQVGDRVHVRANKMQDQTLQATEVKLQNPTGNGNDDDDNNDDGSASVRVAVFDASASESGADTGAFRLTRVTTTSLPITSPLTVNFTLSGTAINGTDYLSLPLTATFLAGQATVDVVVTPLVDAVLEGSETVILTLTNAAPYALGTPVSATVTITEMPVVTVSAFDSTASETGLETGTFRFTRNGSTAAPLVVTYTVSGTAINGTDYQLLSFSVTFLAGQATADVVVTPIADALVEGAETVIVTVTDGAAYDLGSPNSATVTIAG